MSQQENNPLDTTWILDSGATSHITGNPNLISGLRPIATAPMTTAGRKAHQV